MPRTSASLAAALALVSGGPLLAQGTGTVLLPVPENPTTRVATRGANFLEVGIGARGLGMAGGYTRIANPSRVTLMRKIGGNSQTFALNARDMARGNTESAFLVQPGDVITVAESRF